MICETSCRPSSKNYVGISTYPILLHDVSTRPRPAHNTQPHTTTHGRTTTIKAEQHDRHSLAWHAERKMNKTAQRGTGNSSATTRMTTNERHTPMAVDHLSRASDRCSVLSTMPQCEREQRHSVADERQLQRLWMKQGAEDERKVP